MTAVARLDNVTKTYHIGAERSNWRALIPGPLGEPRHADTFDALRNITLEIPAGAAMGIIGSNGAGKSTLLKILAGTVGPTHGTVEVNGTVAPVIELGVGFNPELTGADNLRFGATLLGRTAADLEAKYDSIVEFAGLGDFMGTPLKRYSTGMRARLGFALVSSFEADLVLLDEVLSVGDWAFQQRSLDRIRSLHAAGSAIVAVSHSHWLLTQICKELVLLDHGGVQAIGDPISIVAQYVGSEVIGDGSPVVDDRPFADLVGEPPPDSPVRIEHLEVITPDVHPADPLAARFDLVVTEPTRGALVMSVYTLNRAAFAEPDLGPSELLSQPGTHQVTVRIPSFPVAPGNYHLRVAVISEVSGEDLDQEYLDAVAKETVAFSVLGAVTSRPGLAFGTEWTVAPPDADRHDPDGSATTRR